MAVPTLYEWAGGAGALERLTERFYAAPSIALVSSGSCSGPAARPEG